MNAPGFVDRPLYLFPEFMGTKPVEILINKPSRWVRAWRKRHRRCANSDKICPMATPRTTDRTWNSSLFLWSCLTTLTTCPFFTEGERTGGERGMESLQSWVLQRGREWDNTGSEEQANTEIAKHFDQTFFKVWRYGVSFRCLRERALLLFTWGRRR